MKLLNLKYKMHKLVNLVFYLIIFIFGFLLGFSAEKINFNKLISQFLFIDNVSAQENLTCRDSLNLFNINATPNSTFYSVPSVDGYTLTTSGSSSNFISYLIDVDLNTDYTISVASKTGRLNIYDESIDNYIAGMGDNLNLTFNTGSNKKISLVFYGSGSYSEIQLQKGSNFTSYEPFGKEFCTVINNEDSFYEFAQNIFGEVSEENKFIYDFITFGLVVICFILFVLIVGYIFKKFFGG